MTRLTPALGVLALLAAVPAHADIIFDSSSTATFSTLGADGVADGINTAAQSFYLPSTPGLSVPSVATLSLAEFGTPSSNSAMVYLAPDQGPAGTSGVALGPNLTDKILLGSVSAAGLSTDPGHPTQYSVGIPFATATTIASETFNREYWVVVIFNGSDVVWSYTDSQPIGGIGLAGQAFYNDIPGGPAFNPIGGALTPYGLRVATPEPFSIALLGVGLAGLGVARRRSRNTGA